MCCLVFWIVFWLIHALIIPYPMIAILISIEAYTTTTKQTNVNFFLTAITVKLMALRKGVLTSVGNLLDKHIDIVFCKNRGLHLV